MTFLWGYSMDEQARRRVERHLLQVPIPLEAVEEQVTEALKTSRATRDHIRATAHDLRINQAIPPEQFPGHKGIACANLEGYLGRYSEALADDVDALRAALDEFDRYATGTDYTGSPFEAKVRALLSDGE